MEKKIENGESGRRRFIRKIVKFGALGGLAAAVSLRLREPTADTVNMLLPGQVAEVKASTAYYSDSAQYVLEAYNYGTNYPQAAVKGTVDDPRGRAVWGYASATSGGNTGVLGYTESSTGVGVSGFAAATSGQAPDSIGWGVRGISMGEKGVGVEGYGQATGAIGVRGTGLPGAISIVAQAVSGQTASLQEWVRGDGTPFAVVDKDGQFGIGTATPARQLHIRGNNAVARLDRNVDSASFIFVRTNTDYSQVLKTFTFGVKATGVDAGSFFIGDMHTNVSGSSDNRILIDTTGKVGIGTTNPKSMLHVVGLPAYANNAAALAGGLTAGAFYRTGGDPDLVCVVH